jgi:hypothetical protein
MSNPIHQNLTMNRTRRELLDMLGEKGIVWNEEQLDLYLHFDKTITEEDGMLRLSTVSREKMIEAVIEDLLSQNPVVTTHIVLKALPNTIASSEVEIAKIARESSVVELLPNGIAIKLKSY